MTKWLSFDIEIYNDLEDGQKLDFSITPSVAALASSEIDVQYFYDTPFMSKETAQGLVYVMLEAQKNGYIIFTWNGLSFDFPLLGMYSGMMEECGELAWNSVDGMFLVVCHKGYPLGLDAALTGAGLESKVHSVILNDKTVFSEMNGKEAPRLWRAGEYQAVVDYLRGDVVQPLKLAEWIESHHRVSWTSRSNRFQTFSTEMLTVRECMNLPLPDVSWMSNPKPREEYYSWIPNEVLE